MKETSAVAHSACRVRTNKRYDATRRENLHRRTKCSFAPLLLRDAELHREVRASRTTVSSEGDSPLGFRIEFPRPTTRLVVRGACKFLFFCFFRGLRVRFRISLSSFASRSRFSCFFRCFCPPPLRGRGSRDSRRSIDCFVRDTTMRDTTAR